MYSDNHVYFLPQELGRMNREWWTLHDCMKAWGRDEDDTATLWLKKADWLGVTEIHAVYPSGTVIAYTVIPAGQWPQWATKCSPPEDKPDRGAKT